MTSNSLGRSCVFCKFLFDPVATLCDCLAYQLDCILCFCWVWLHWLWKGRGQSTNFVSQLTLIFLLIFLRVCFSEVFHSLHYQQLTWNSVNWNLMQLTLFQGHRVVIRFLICSWKCGKLYQGSYRVPEIWKSVWKITMAFPELKKKVLSHRTWKSLEIFQESMNLHNS